ncbi:chymotrypsin-elastase inhibitor ixodidin-like [Athalia rosae]|uniref:chymotrypsin-elastase inhibitor ixodidin-like n=1 Tax=Athalia rosae TaxID=37344 RepID=UPI002033B565|nr:chymotrypsin-elastase inhibitor ixodidin-like [Athalia rosae]
MIMLRFAVVLFFFVCLTYATEHEDDHCCDKGERWYDCGTCELRCGEEPQPCTDECKKGCMCKEGYRRNCNNRCVPEKCCPYYPSG